ncbi:MAG: hypothetical protein ACOYLH_08055 [Flavobacteriales bacterium]
MKLSVFLFSLILVALNASGQFQVRDSSLFNPHFTISYCYHSPGGDMADRFGNNGGLGLGFHIKSKTNWYYGIQGTYIFGKRVSEPGLLSNLATDAGEILDNQGQIAKVYIQERGYTVTANFGRIFSQLGPNPNSGLLVMGGIGFMQHKIRIEHQENEIRFLEDDYLKGYDRLTNGLTAYEFLGYYLMSNNKLVNFIVGVEAYQGFTQGRRDLNFDTGITDNAKRRDNLFGVRIGWTLHLYQRTPDQFYYN